MARRMMRKHHVRCRAGEKVEITSKPYLSLFLYMTANSASGSKYYELLSTQQDYVAARSQNWLPSYSVITLTADTFSIDTYQITDDGKAEAIDDTFTIKKTGADTTDTSADTTDSADEETDSSDNTDTADNADASADAAAETSEN